MRTQLAQAVEEILAKKRTISESLASRAKAIAEQSPRPRNWDETKREILGRLPSSS